MKVFISVVSHGHGDLIKRLNCLKVLSKNFIVVVKINSKDDLLLKYCTDNNIFVIDENYFSGFGKNNNINFVYCKEKLGMTSDDIFIVLNPDVIITNESVNHLAEYMISNDINIAGCNLYKDYDFTFYDNSVRRFPSLINFFLSFIGMGNDTIVDKVLIEEPTQVDWISGSLLSFKSNYYERLGGFDEKYFMYCEDIDICYRSSILGYKVTYIPFIKAVHLAKHANRTIFSKHFYWHVKSIYRFLLTKRSLTKNVSIIMENEK